MTDTPTLAAMLEWLDYGINIDDTTPCDFRTMLKAIRAALVEQNERTIPPLPEGWTVDRFRLVERPAMGDVFIEDRGNGKWVLINKPDVLNKNGEWEFEPMPSGRNQSFVDRTRYDNPQQAANAFLASIAKINQTEGV